MSDTDECCAVIVAILMEKKIRKKRKQRIWVKDWLKMRGQLSHDRLVVELKHISAADYQNYLRMDTFEVLLEEVL